MHAVALGNDLNVDPSNWHWVHCLTLPVETLKTLSFSQRPYKWIRYAIGVVVGAEGHLSFSTTRPMFWNTMMTSKWTLLFKLYTITPATRRSEGCSQ